MHKYLLCYIVVFFISWEEWRGGSSGKEGTLKIPDIFSVRAASFLCINHGSDSVFIKLWDDW